MGSIGKWADTPRARDSAREGRLRQTQHPLGPGILLDRRGFVELALASAGGATLVGAFPAAAIAADESSTAAIRSCDGSKIPMSLAGGHAGQDWGPDVVAQQVRETFLSDSATP